MTALTHLPAVMASFDGSQRLNQGQVFGVPPSFLPDTEPLRPGQVILNQAVAARFQVAVGDSLLLRITKPSAMPQDTALAADDSGSVALRVEITAVVAGDQRGNLDPFGQPTVAFNAFLDREWLNERLQVVGLANLLLVAETITADHAATALDSAWRLADLGLTVQSLASDWVEIRSRRVFLDESVIDGVARAFPGALGVLTYFVNSIKHGDSVTPYSTVTGAGFLGSSGSTETVELAPLTLPIGPGNVVLGEWLAEDLSAQVGDHLQVDYYKVNQRRELIEESVELKVSAIVPMVGLAADSELMPDFPGLKDSENCRDWEPGIPVDLDRIRDRDEEYWDDFKGTPKAWLGLKQAQTLWHNRFGNLTAIRCQHADAPEFARTLRAQLDPAASGLFFQDVKSRAQLAVNSPTDFGSLFVGLSMFLVVAALLLAGLLFVFGIEQRLPQLGMLQAVGFPEAKVRWLLLAEALAIAAGGALLGVIFGITYTKGILWGLGSVWRDAIASVPVTFVLDFKAVLLGGGLTILVGLGALAISLRMLRHQSATALLNGTLRSRSRGTKSRRWHGLLVLAGIVGAILLLVVGWNSTGPEAGWGVFWCWCDAVDRSHRSVPGTAVKMATNRTATAHSLERQSPRRRSPSTTQSCHRDPIWRWCVHGFLFGCLSPRRAAKTCAA